MVGTSNKSDPGMAIRVNHLRQPAFGYGMGDVITADQCVGDQGLFHRCCLPGITHCSSFLVAYCFKIPCHPVLVKQ